MKKITKIHPHHIIKISNLEKTLYQFGLDKVFRVSKCNYNIYITFVCFVQLLTIAFWRTKAHTFLTLNIWYKSITTHFKLERLILLMFPGYTGSGGSIQSLYPLPGKLLLWGMIRCVMKGSIRRVCTSWKGRTTTIHLRYRMSGASHFS